MEKTFVEIPKNFEEVSAYVITDRQTIVREIMTAEKVFFYDACTFRYHVSCNGLENILFFIAHQKGIVVLTRLILMELLSGDDMLWEEHIDYLKRLHDTGIKVLIIYEEDVLEVLETCYSSIKEINEKLRLAVGVMKSADSAIGKYIDEDAGLKAALWGDMQKQSRDLIPAFFRAMRGAKTVSDSLGEEAVGVCLHMLSSIPELTDGKYVFLSDDKGAVRKYSNLIVNVEKYAGHPMIVCVTTPKLVYRLVKEGRIDNEKEIVDILECCASEGRLTVMASQMYELKAELKAMSVLECAEKMLNEFALVVYW